MRNTCDKAWKVLFTVSAAWPYLTICQGITENTDLLVAAIVTLVNFLLMAFAHISLGMLVFFFLIRGAFDIACYWSFLFLYSTWDVLSYACYYFML